MSLYIHNYFKFYSAKTLLTDFLDYPEIGYVHKFPTGIASPFYYNGISFTEIEPEDLATFAEDYDFSYLMWYPTKMIASHSETDDEVDPSRGNRAVSIPLMIKRSGVASYGKWQAAHNKAQPIEFQSYVELTQLLTIRFKDVQLGSSIDEWKDQQLVVARNIPIADTVFEGYDGLEIILQTQVDEWLCDVISFDGKTMVLYLITPPVVAADLSDVTVIGPNNQTMFIVPLGHVIAATEAQEYTGQVTSLGEISWTYLDPDVNTTAKYKILTPKIQILQTALGDGDKYVIVLERVKSFTNFGNGFQLLVDVNA